MKHVQIIDRQTGQVAAAVPFPALLARTDSIDMGPQFETEAWRMAIRDQLVDPGRRVDYLFRVIETVP